MNLATETPNLLSELPDENWFVGRGSELIKLKIQLQVGDLIWCGQWLLVNLKIGIQNNSIYAIKI